MIPLDFDVLLNAKWLLVLALPFIVLIMFGAWLVVYTRNGRPIRLTVRGLGILIEVDTSTSEKVTLDRKNES